MADWQRTERHRLDITGPAVVDAVELVAELNQAFSDYWLIANAKPHSEVPAGAVTVSAAGGVLVVRVEHIEATKEPEPEPGGDQPVEAPDETEGEPGDG